MVHAVPSRRQACRIGLEAAIVLVGIALLACAWAMDEQWLATHFPPDYSPPYSLIRDLVQMARIVLAVAGIGVIFLVRGKAGLILERGVSGTRLLLVAAVILAIILALGAADLVLGSSEWGSVEPRHRLGEPLRKRDPMLGWVLMPSHTGYLVTGGRRIRYSNDAFGYREPDQNHAPDFARPTIVLAGESVMGGFGLQWDESIAGQLAPLMKTQVVDLSVGGYATDQIYLRLKSELRRFRQPVAVVMLFSPMLFRRNGEDGRPHLGPDLVWHPAVGRSKLAALARWAIPYRSVEETDRSIHTTRAILKAFVSLAKSRGAIPVVLVPQFVPENPAEQQIRLRVLGNIDLPVVSVSLDQHWRVPQDWHPNAHAAQVIATAIARRLGPLLDHHDVGVTDRLSPLQEHPSRASTVAG